MFNQKISALKSSAIHELLVVDQHIEAVDILLAGLARPIEVVELETYLPPFEQIATILANRPDVKTLHILSHGTPGKLALAGQMVDAADLAQRPAALDSIKSSLGLSGKIALWACSVAAGPVGEQFVDALSKATGATIFAAEGPVGAAAKGGTWDIGITSPFGKAAEDTYPYTLSTFDFTSGVGSISTGTITQTISSVTTTVKAYSNRLLGELKN